MDITRYAVKAHGLTPWVKFIWQLNAADADYYYKLLPTDCIDVIINSASGMVYETEQEAFAAPSIHINGLRSKHSFIRQKGCVRIWGVSFYAFGLYPFVHQPITELQDKIVDLQALSLGLAQKLKAAVSPNSGNTAAAIEEALIDEYKVDQDFMEKARVIADYLSPDNQATVALFCENQAINMKTFERMCLKYTGFTPKALRSIRRFQATGNQLTRQNASSLTAIAYDHSFTDQAHFSKEFRRFSGAAPQAFQREKITVKQNVNYTFR